MSTIIATSLVIPTITILASIVSGTTKSYTKTTMSTTLVIVMCGTISVEVA